MAGDNAHILESMQSSSRESSNMKRLFISIFLSGFSNSDINTTI